jgi:hypothetical protein
VGGSGRGGDERGGGREREWEGRTDGGREESVGNREEERGGGRNHK